MNSIGLDRVQTDNNYNFKHIFNENDDNNTSTLYDNIGHCCDDVEMDNFS